MVNKAGKKGKKPLQTTLGKASSQNEKEVDLSHVQKPIHTSLFGLRQVLSLFQTATEEVQNYITYECDIMYECRTCRTIFRSLANFILHKRNYCRERFRQHLDVFSNNELNHENECKENSQDKGNEESRPVTSDQNESSPSKEAKKELSPIIEKLKKKQEIYKLAQEALNEDLSSKDTEDNTNKTNNDKKNKRNDLLLERIATNNAAVFQTVLQNIPSQQLIKEEYMKSEVMEIHGILDSDEAVLGPDGKICNFETNKVNENPIIPKGDLFCTECNLNFSTKKTLTYHIKYKHNYTRLVYTCPDCKDTFANAWCVYRHLYKIHRRTSAQIKRLREQIHNSCVRRGQELTKKKDKKYQEKVDKTDEENQWLNNIEGDNDFQMCGGCGKRFERKAALHSHAQMCTKRIAVCNTIKENNARKKEEEHKESKQKIPKVEQNVPSEILKGSLKRKPYLLRTYKPNDKQTISNPNTGTSQVCDVNANCEIMQFNCDSGENKEEKHITIKLRNSPSSTEDITSPNIKDICSSSVDTIDTESMLNIIGVTSIAENIGIKNDDGEKSCSSKELETENKFHSVTDFDTFCKNIAEQLITNAPEETESYNQKTSRTIPLILRRRNSSKPEKRNTILDQKNESSTVTKTNVTLDNNDVLDNKNLENVKETPEIGKSPSTSAFRISVKSLEDLIDVSNETCKKKIAVSGDHAENHNLDATSIINAEETTFEEVSDTVRANVSPEKLKQKFPKSLKRKRTASFDYTGINKSSKQEAQCLSNKHDVNFISKASPYMDQEKLLCIPCQLTYLTLSKLLWHMSAHFSWFRFQCSRCSFISFNKWDCANHARRSHNIRKDSIQSVVLPIPNWKTALMANDFCMLKDENDLSGKHTDEIIFANQDETANEVFTKRKDDDVIKEAIADWDNDLFVDTIFLESETDNNCDYSTNLSTIKQEGINGSIDIVDDIRDSHQIEVPQEIYTLDVSEIMNGVDNREERIHLASHVKIEKAENDDENEESYYMPQQNDDKVPNKIKSELSSEDETAEEFLKDKSYKSISDANITPKKNPEDAIVNVRPTRNRMRSIKTLHDDFFYDLSKVIKLNDNSVTKPALQQKHKKNNPSTSQKSIKETISSSSKNETKTLRVYSKKNK